AQFLFFILLTCTSNLRRIDHLAYSSLNEHLHSAVATIPVSGESKPPSNQASIALVSESQSKTTSSATTGDKKGEDGLPVSATTTVAPSSTSAIVCKVLPQKQPECSAAAATSSVVTVAPSTRPESSTTFSNSNTSSNNPVSTQLTSNQSLSFRRAPLGDVGDWLCVGKADAPAPLFLNSCNPGKKMDNTMAQEMSSVFMQHQQQSFRQQQQAVAPPQLMNFGLHELTLRNHQGSLRDNYFTAFSGGGNNGSQQRNIYTTQQKGGATGWQTASWQPPPQPAQAAHFEPNGLWPNNYNTPPPQPQTASYVGVIGADRPSTNNSVATQQHQSRLQQQQQHSAVAAAAAQAAAFAAASIYGRGGGVGANGAGQQPYPQPHPQPGGLYAQSQSQQQTPPPHLSFDPNVSTAVSVSNQFIIYFYQMAGVLIVIISPGPDFGASQRVEGTSK
ncbi:unnamed protein product, partial [Rodentolepis nana]|uniref:Maternal protein pumilio n=1 Tax=Rodentolepis nana TaxID=102285 RepID=A0A0R3THP6_RODNA